jgi:hypothetical protein
MNTIINNIHYTLKKITNNYIITKNTNNLVVLSYKFSIYNCNTNLFEITNEGILEDFNEVAEITLIKDGKYKLEFNIESDVIGDSSIANTFIGFYHFNNLKTQLVKELKAFLCDDCNCKCKDNSDCTSKEAKFCLKHKKLFSKLETYRYNLSGFLINSYVIDNIKLFRFIQTVISNNSCLLTKELCKELLEISLGKPYTNEKTYKFYIALYYLGIYFTEKYIDTELSEADNLIRLNYLNTSYNYNEIINCICGLGLDINTLEQLYNNISGVINDNININLPPIQASLITIFPLINESETQTFILTADNFLDNYSDPEDNAPFYIRISNFTLPNTIRLLLNNNQVEPNSIINFADIYNGLLSIEVDEITNPIVYNIPYNIADEGSNQLGAGNVINILVSSEDTYENLPPISIGDINVLVETNDDYFLTIPFQQALDNYIDPENDEIENIIFTQNYPSNINILNIISELGIPSQTDIPYNIITQGQLGLFVSSTKPEGEYILPFKVSDIGSSTYGATGNINITVKRPATYDVVINSVNGINVIDNIITLPNNITLANIIATETSNINTTSINWTLISTHNHVITINNNTTLFPTVVGLQQGNTYTLRLTVINDGNTYIKEIKIIVTAIITTPFQKSTGINLQLQSEGSNRVGITENLMNTLLNNYFHPNGLLPTNIIIVTTPGIGFLEIDGGLSPINANNTIILDYNPGQTNDRFQYVFDYPIAVSVPLNTNFYFYFTDINGNISNIALCQINLLT